MTPTRRKILLVDDSTTALIMEELLLRRSYDVVKATSGPDALRIASEQRPDLILLDVVMPNMDGLETCRLLRAIPVTRSTPIIMVTTRGEDTTRQNAFANGATDFITKPIDGRTLLEKVEQHLGAGA